MYINNNERLRFLSNWALVIYTMSNEQGRDDERIAMKKTNLHLLRVYISVVEIESKLFSCSNHI